MVGAEEKSPKSKSLSIAEPEAEFVTGADEKPPKSKSEEKEEVAAGVDPGIAFGMVGVSVEAGPVFAGVKSPKSKSSNADEVTAGCVGAVPKKLDCWG